MENVVKVATRLPEELHKKVLEIAKRENRTPHAQRLVFIAEGVKKAK